MIIKFISYIKENVDDTEYLIPAEEPIKISDLIELYGSREGLISFLNEKYKDKIIRLENLEDEDTGTIYLIVEKFKILEDKMKVQYTQYTYEVDQKLNSNEYRKGVPEHCDVFMSDTICEMKVQYTTRKFTEEDPYGEENWEV